MSIFNCPKCGNSFTSAKVEGVDLTNEAGTWRGLVFTCKGCGVLLGIQVDPILLQDRILEAIEEVKNKIQ